MGYRSGGPAPQTWLAPDVTGMIEEAAADGAAAVVVCDLLTVTENVEVVYDCGHDCSVKPENSAWNSYRFNIRTIRTIS
ncbi:hypothetical protein [Paenibacillus sp. GYB004]|uniref:hypothetical protein n=1 Tax=Paenibacillus sp. GYB004 TaxID=2994393 RepID=UPI003FA691BD